MRLKRIKSFFLLCWFTYIAAYLCRINISSALAKMQVGLEVSQKQLGLIGSLFFISYAIGQLINGFAGDKISPYKFLAFSTFGTAAANLLIASSNSLTAVYLFWFVNGYFQSAFWGPLMRILSMKYTSDEHLRLATKMSSTLIVGFLSSWVLLGRLFIHQTWQLYFIVPALIMLAFCGAWVVVAIREKSERSPLNRAELLEKLHYSIETISKQKLAAIIAVCLLMGVIKESLSFWAPFILTNALGVELKNSLLYIAIIPCFNFLGLFLVNRFAKIYANSVTKILRLLFSVILLCSLALTVFRSFSPLGVVLLVSVISAMTYGCHCILISFIPLSFAKKNLVSTLVGVFDCSSYVGAALSTYFFAGYINTTHWFALPMVWLIDAVLALLLLVRLNKSRATFA